VIPQFHDRDAQGIPTAWVARMRESMARLTPHFSSNRTVREYVEQHYLRAASAYRERSADKGALGVQIVHWKRALEREWPALRFSAAKAGSEDGHHLLEVKVTLGELDPGAVRIEFYAAGAGSAEASSFEATRLPQSGDASNGYVYSARVPATRPASDYTARVIPHRSGVAVPLEATRILWQR